MSENPTLLDIYERMGGMDSKLDTVVVAHLDHEKRIRLLEVARNYAAGALGVLSAIGALKLASTADFLSKVFAHG